MKQFLKLSKHIINVKCIEKIVIENKAYKIQILNNDISGFMIYGSGFVSNERETHHICVDKSPIDYNIVKKFIDEC
jgi:hypothetical protein